MQNFLPTPKEVVEVFPSRSEMRLLRILRLARVAVFAIAVLCIAYFAFGVGSLIRRPEWSFDPAQAEVTKGRLGKLSIERKKADHWNNLLDDRSKAWANMESFSRMFPETGGMLVKSYTHSAKPENTPGKATVGLIKEWKIAGYARDEALDYLNTINTREGISAHFSEIARITGNSSLQPEHRQPQPRRQRPHPGKQQLQARPAGRSQPHGRHRPIRSPSTSPSPSASKPPIPWRSPSPKPLEPCISIAKPSSCSESSFPSPWLRWSSDSVSCSSPTWSLPTTTS